MCRDLEGLERWMIDVRTVEGKSATAIALGGTEGASRSAEQEKQRRHKGHVQALSVELRGCIASTETEASQTTVVGGSDCEAVQRWNLSCFEAAEALRAVHGALEHGSTPALTSLINLPCGFSPCVTRADHSSSNNQQHWLRQVGGPLFFTRVAHFSWLSLAGSP